jgi:hypothetical protein
MPLPFENVREQLLLAGIAPRHAGRYVTELREHLTDLIAQENASGLDSVQAEERALTLLGSETQLVQAALNQGTPHSLTARAPWSVLAVCPALLLLLVVVVTAISMMQVLSPVRGLAPADIPAGYSSLIAGVTLFANYLIGPLLAAGCIAIALRQRLASGWVWVGLCLIAVLSGPLGFHMNYIPAEAGESGRTLYSAAGIVYQNGRADLATTLGVAFVRAAVLFTMAATFYRALQRRFMPARA